MLFQWEISNKNGWNSRANDEETERQGKKKKLIRGLSIFDKLVKYANENEDASFF